MRFIVITGGVVSGLGKGITASSIALLLKSYGNSVSAIKIDPYINIDAGTMSPYEHGECYVLKDGGESDLDLGNYERFLGINLTKQHNITTGKIYQRVIERERRGDYLGKTVQIVPHITGAIQEWIEEASNIPVDGLDIPDFCMIEVGGTIGDMETAPFIEAIRQMSMNTSHRFCFIHVSLLLENGGELKTKPTQQSVASLRSLGIVPDMLVLRTPAIPSIDLLSKVSVQCNINKQKIIVNTNVPNIYYVPQLFHNQAMIQNIYSVFGIIYKHYINPNFGWYTRMMDYNNRSLVATNRLCVLIAGKYMNTPDTYLSIIRALDHAAFATNVFFDIKWFDTETDSINTIKESTPDAVIIPGGFGSRGIAGKIEVARFCRENSIPTLGICLGMQIMVCERIGADSQEWNPSTETPAIHLLSNQTEVYGGTMRLGDYEAVIHITESKTYQYYGKIHITERHRHRYEVNNAYRSQLEEKGMKITAVNDEHNLVEIVEQSEHPYYIGCQFHPEYSSKNELPHPLFVGLLEVANQRRGLD
jgi:CTP synthase